MNMDTLNELITQLNDLKDQVATINQTVAALKIDAQYWVKSDAKINPGIGCKVAYNKDGIIVNSSALEASDIPTISIDQVANLRKELESNAKAAASKLNEIDMTKVFTHTEVIGTACKVNYDKHGMIVDGSSLIEEDIPKLSIDHIDGLPDILDELKNRPINNAISEHTSVIKPSTGCKISFDQFGHVTNVAKLSLTDIPNELIVHINEIESTLSTMASQKALNNINSIVTKKLDANPQIEPGIYTKVMVDSNGLVIGGKKLTVSDLPQLNISDIEGLQLELKNKVGIDKFNSLNDDLNIYMNSISMPRINEAIDKAIKKCASKFDIDTIQFDVNNLRSSIESISERLPSDMISDEISKVTSAISTLSGRIAVLDKQYSAILDKTYPLVSKS